MAASNFLRLFETPLRYEVSGDYDGGFVHAWSGSKHAGYVEHIGDAIAFIFVHPEFRRQGVATALIQELRSKLGMDTPLGYGDTSPEGRKFLRKNSNWFNRSAAGNVDHRHNPYGDTCEFCAKIRKGE